MIQNIFIFMFVELILFCVVLYLIIRANIAVNNMQAEVNDLYFYLPVALRDIKSDLKKFNKSIQDKFQHSALTSQEIGLLAGKIFSEVILARFKLFPLKQRSILASIMLNLWNIRQRLQESFLGMFLKTTV